MSHVPSRRAAARRILLIGLAALAVALLPAPGGGAVAADMLNQGMKVGEAIPAFSAQDQSGVRRDFASLVGRNGLIVLFSRSFDW